MDYFIRVPIGARHTVWKNNLMKFVPLLVILLFVGACDSERKTAVSDAPEALALSGETTGSDRPACTDNALRHGDRWGWENGATCIWDASPTNRGKPACTAAAMNTGAGWGWENNRTCRWGSGTLSGAAVVASDPSDTSARSSNDSVTTTCSANASDSGGGWGWEYGAPCKWGSVRPSSNRTEAYVAGPVRLQVPGYDDNGKPICLTDSSDGNADGFGFEYGRTCTVVDGKTATVDNPLLNERWCMHWAEISYGDYILQNNTWNDSEVYSNDWHQCIELGGSRGNYVAKWDYNWLDKNRGNEYAVKSYPQVFYGRKTRNSISGDPDKLGVPVSINSMPKFKVRYKYSETGDAERNVALESFFHTSCEAEEWNKQFELMVWVGVPVTRGPGPKVAEVNFDGVDWNVHLNPTLGWGYVAFVAAEPQTEGWLDWNKFIDWTRYEGPAYGVPRIQNNTCLGAIEIGTETFWGRGTFTLDEFRVVKQ